MTKKDAAKIVRQRTRPKLFDFCYLMTRAHLKSFLEWKNLLKKTKKPVKILDLGCGYKPFLKLLKGIEIKEYIGVDFDKNRSSADVASPIDNLPLKDNDFDAVILSEVLEHTPDLEKAINEMKRVAKNDALVYISTPFVFGEHGVPYDFQRITRYKYFELFKQDEILSLKETNSNLSTVFFVANLCLESIAVFKMIPLILPLIYLVNNIFGMLSEALVYFAGWIGNKIFHQRKEWFQKLCKSYFYTMPAGYDLIIKIKK